LDDWKADHLAIMMAFGNSVVNAVYEARVPETRSRPAVDAPAAEVEAWIRDKYQHRKFIAAAAGGDASKELFRVVSAADGTASSEDRLAAVARCTKAEINRTDHNEEKRTALHAAAARGDINMTQLLLWAGADLNIVDGGGKTPLQKAREGKWEPTFFFLCFIWFFFPRSTYKPSL